MMKISNAVASSVYAGIADDALKDEDNGIWLATLPKSIQAIWRERFHWIRRVDRLAEQDQIVQPGGEQFPAFYQAWKRLKAYHCLSPGDANWPILRQIETTWFLEDGGHLHQAEIEAWDCYMDAIADYHQPQLTLQTVSEYEEMLTRLAGSCFAVLPFLAPHQRAHARQFGVVDQFYNNLRDLYEDSCQGICYFPQTLLDKFGVQRSEIIDQSCFQNPGYFDLMEFWVNRYLPQLRQHHLGLLTLPDLHPSWQCLTTWFMHRYQRIEQVLQVCEYDFVAFANEYWPVVERDLQEQTRRLQPPQLWGIRPSNTAARMMPSLQQASAWGQGQICRVPSQRPTH
jgi:phytoene synthase